MGERTTIVMDPAGHVIPPMTDPHGRYWDQPPRERILVDDTHALMSTADFEALPEYSATVPSGAYEGKMWRRHDGAFDVFSRHRHANDPPPRWLLCWYGYSDKPDCVSVNYREVILV